MPNVRKSNDSEIILITEPIDSVGRNSNRTNSRSVKYDASLD
jgi:hypothetical protein